MATVIATKKGFFLKERQIGDEFEFPDEMLQQKDGKPVFPSWFAPPAEAKQTIAAAEQKKKKPPKPADTMSGLNKTRTDGEGLA